MSTRASAGAYKPPRPALITRAQWGADESWRCGTNRLTSTVQAAIVHHTAGVNSYTKAESAGIVRGIYAYHTKTLGWCDVGYNVLVDKYGQIFEGRAGGLDKPVLGAHATSWNTDTVGVSFMGNYETAAAPAVMLEAGAQVIAYKFGIYGRDPKSRVTLAGKTIYRISGHGDVMQTACPGVNVRSKLSWMRDRVATLMKTPTTTSPAPATPATTAIGQRWQSLGGGSSYLGWPIDVEKKIGDGTWREFRAYDMFDSPRTDPFWTTGSIRTRYRALGTATGVLGFPTSDQRSGWPVSGASGNTFEKGAIVSSKTGGTRAITGAFWTTYSADSGLRSRISVPWSEAKVSGFGTLSQTFKYGRLFENKGIKVMEGQIYAHWSKQSTSTKLALGQPSANAVSVTSSTGTKATLQTLTKSTYVVSGGKVKVVKGGVLTAWKGFGGEKGKLGLPTGDQTTVSGGVKQNFEKGSISVVNGETIIRYR
nr:N-acetylmuramoyl-L-alanine amidase [Auraticoccus cholistanensis]